LPTLEFASAGAPFQLKDGAWGIDAAAGFILNPGRYAFDLEHTGPVQVFVDNLEKAQEGADANGLSLHIEFDSKGGVSVIHIVANDTGGPFRLKLVTAAP